MNKCEHCKDVHVKHEIRSPAELKKAIQIVRANLSDKTILESEYWPKGIDKIELEPFNKIKESGPYLDNLQYYFECPMCKQIYKLSCETYHGIGGEWSPVE